MRCISKNGRAALTGFLFRPGMWTLDPASGTLWVGTYFHCEEFMKDMPLSMFIKRGEPLVRRSANPIGISGSGK